MNLIPMLRRYRWFVAAAAIVIILAIIGAYLALRNPAASVPLEAPSEFQSGNFSFTYPRVYAAKEYAAGVTSLGGLSQGVFIPLIDVVRYKSDPDSAQPASFDAFAAHQAEALCGSDGAGVSLVCTTPVVKPYANPAGFAGEELSLTLVRKDLKTGATTDSAYGPIYIFNTTAPVPPGEPIRYQGVFVYPDFSSFVLASSSANLVADVAATLTITSGSSVIVGTTTAK